MPQNTTTDTADLINRLEKLIQLDIDAVGAYEQAIEAIDILEVRDRLAEFRDDHERHVAELSAALRRMGGEPPRRSPDMKGFLIEGYTAVRSSMGSAGALRAMKT